MKELEDTSCEIRRIIELQSSIWDHLNNLSEDEQPPVNGTSNNCESTKSLGGFLDGSNHVWLSCGSRLIVFNARTGESISSWNFRCRISSVSPFPTQPGRIPLLLVGLDNDAHRIKDSVGLVCVFDCTSSRILRVIRMPCGVEQICVISGGAEWEIFNDQKIATMLGTNSGIACVALRNLDHIIIELQRSSWESVNSYLITDELSPFEIEFPQYKSSSSSSKHSYSREKHTAYCLLNSRIEKYLGFNRETFESTALSYEKLSTALISSKKIGCLISGVLGRVMLWQSDGAIGWISPLFDENMSVSHLALIEPADDPRPFHYLWIACQDDSGIAAPVLRMYAMLFEKKYCEKDSNFYFNLESDPSLKFEIELDEGDIINCLLPIERENNSEQSESGARLGEESLLLIGTNNRMLLFDLNQWYKEQMPQTASECQNPNSILASYRTRSEMPNSVKDVVINCSYVSSSLKEFTSSGPNSSEELFFPNSLSFQWLELTSNRITLWMTRGVQADLLRNISLTGPVILIQPEETFHRCLAAGLVPFSTECSYNSDHNTQREMLLSLCLEQLWASFLIKCAKEWSDGSASYMFPAFLRWGVQRGSTIKIRADQLSIPLFDQSGTDIGESEAKTLRFCCQQLECLSSVVEKLAVESVDFLMQQRALKRIAIYLQVLLWFHDVGLLPETQVIDESTLRIALSMKIPYRYERLASFYKEKREQLRIKRSGTEDDNLFIDILISRECASLKSQWEREGVDVGSGGQYPPPSLQSLLRSYLADCYHLDSNEIENKHQITIYLLMDLAMLLQGSCPSIDQLIKYPAAFKLSPSIIKLTQAFWLLDHEDYQGFLDMMTGQLVSDSDIKDWHHNLVIKTLVQDSQHKLALMYLRVRKPPLKTIEEQGIIISLSVEHGLVQSAFHCRPSSHYAQLLTPFFRACKSYGKLSEILHLALDKEEEEAFVKFLEEDKCEETKLLYYLQRCRHAEANSISFGSRFNPQLEQPISLNMFKAYNATLPDVTKRFTACLNKKNPDMDPDFRYPRPMSHAMGYNRTQEIHETVVKKAKETYVRREKTQIPFVSAPCLSLKSSSRSTDINCVLFLEKKVPVKRTIHQIQDSEDIARSSEKKRRKLSEDKRFRDRSVEDRNLGNRSTTRKSVGENNLHDKTPGDKSELGIDALFSTPLIKRKNQFTNLVNIPVETPQSILKIRQMIKNSASPNINSLQSSDNASDPILEKKPRQIRFSVSQLNNDSMQSESLDDNVTKETINESVPKEVIDEEPSEISGETFFSPNVSEKSEESTILTDSSYYGRNLSGPRPRPSLRRSINLSSNESSRRNSIKTGSTSSVGTLSSVSIISKDLLNSSTNSFDFNAVKNTNEIQSPCSTSVYSTSILSDSSFEDQSKRLVNDDKGLDWSVKTSFCKDKDVSPGKLVRVSQSISIESVTKTVIEEFEVDDEDEGNNEEVDEKENVNEIQEVKHQENIIEMEQVNYKEEEENIESNKESEIDIEFERNRSTKLPTIEIETENLSTKETQSFGEAKLKERITEQNGEVIMHVEEKLEEVGKVQGIHEDTNMNILPEGSVVSTQERHSFSEDEIELGDESSDDSELLALKHDDDDEEEVFESLSNSISSELIHSLSSSQQSNFNKQVMMEKSHSSKSIAEDISITDDESMEALDHNTLEQTDKTLRDKEKEDEFNITDDESEKGYKQESEGHTDLQEPSKSDSKQYSTSDSKSLGNLNNAMVVSSNVDSKENNTLSIKKPEKVTSETIEEVSKKNVYLRRTPERQTRAKRASSIAKEARNANIAEASLVQDETEVVLTEFKKDNIKKSNITKDKTPVRETRSQKSLTSRKDSLASQEDQIFNEGVKTPKRDRRSSRASSVTKIVEPTNEGLTPDVEIENAEKIVSRSQTSVRETKSRKASLSSKNAVPQHEEVETEKVRTRRGSSLVKEILTASVEAGNNRDSRKISSGSEGSVDTPTKRGRPRKNTNVVQETSTVSSEAEKESEVTVDIVRRSTRRAASVQKELSILGEAEANKQKTVLATTIEELVDIDTSVPAKRNTRSKRGSSITKEIPPPRITRASSLSKDVEQPATPSPRQTRRRGNSVPKEMPLMPARGMRSTSISEEVILEEPVDEDQQLTTNLSLTSKVLSEVTSIPVSKKRTRRPSVQSIPEEAEETLSVPSKNKVTKNQKKEPLSRARRATSVDLPVEPKRHTRSTRLKSTIIEEAILEEPVEAEKEAQISSNKVVKKQPARRKRAASETILLDQKEEPEAKSSKEKPRRGRKISQRTEDGNEFAFSPPEKTVPPKDKKGIREVPSFVFSPPHTRSKQTIQPRRIIPFVEPLTEEEKKIAKSKATEMEKNSEIKEKPKKLPVKMIFPRKTFRLSKNQHPTSE